MCNLFVFGIQRAARYLLINQEKNITTAITGLPMSGEKVHKSDLINHNFLKLYIAFIVPLTGPFKDYQTYQSREKYYNCDHRIANERGNAVWITLMFYLILLHVN